MRSVIEVKCNFCENRININKHNTPEKDRICPKCLKEKIVAKSYKVYSCGKCGKKHDTQKAGEVKGWFILTVKCYYGCDKKDTHEHEVCGIKCVSKIMAAYEEKVSINWSKLKAINY